MNFAHNHGRHECGWNVLSRAAATPFRFGNHQISNKEVASDTAYDTTQHLIQYHTPSQCSEQHTEKNQNDLLIANEHQITHRKKALQSFSKSLVNSLTQKIQQQPIPGNSIFNKYPASVIHSNNSVIHTAVQSKSKLQKSRKKRRKNNTGFYYGIREDVLVLPEKPWVKQVDGSPSTKISTKKKSASKEDKSFAEENSDISFDQAEHSPPMMQQQPTDMYRGNSLQEKKLDPPKSRLQGLSCDDKDKKKKIRKNTQSQRVIDKSKSSIFDETLQELREMKDEIIALREELRTMKGKMQGGDESVLPSSLQSEVDEKPKWWARPSSKELVFDTPPDSITKEEQESALPMQTIDESSEEKVSPPKSSPRMRRREFEQIGRNVETWACRLLFDQESTEEDGWKEIECNKFCRKKFNSDGNTKVYLKWMPDSRTDNDGTENSDSGDDQEYPCIRCYSTINAPIDKVCSFLSNENTIPDYNELIEDYCDIEEITPHSKITWCKMPKIMFVKSRDFVTYCSHRWWRDGTQVIVNQACEHSDKPGTLKEGEGEACRGYALRGANFISQDPDDPNKTRISLLAHANPGGGMPQWVRLLIKRPLLKKILSSEQFRFRQ